VRTSNRSIGASTGAAVTRRGFGRLAAGTAIAAAPFVGRANAQAPITLRWMTSQTAPAQRAAYTQQINAFQAANPNVRVVIEPTSDGSYPVQLAAAFSSRQVPNLITHLPSFAVANYWRSGLLEPMNFVIDAIGRENYFPGANRAYELEPGVFAAVGLGNTASDMLWVRRDLMERAGVAKIPETFDELRSACQRMQRGGIFGAPLPYGRNSMTSSIFVGFIHRAGGQVFTPDLQLAIESDEVLNALEFYRSMREFSPPGATNYQWGDSIAAFVSGATATGIYSGRVLQNVMTQNPPLRDAITCTEYPTISPAVPKWTFNNFPSVFMPKDAPNIEITRRFVLHLFQPDGYIRQMHAAPGHILPTLKPIAENPAYLANEVIQRYRAEVDLMSAAAASGHNLGYESPRHRINIKAGEVQGSDLIGELVQRVCVNRENPRVVLGEVARRIDTLMRG
jgi:multiple sugar transport system substrate-binding protein